MIKAKVLRSMRKTVLGLMLSACVLTTSGVALDNVAMAASDTKKTTSSDTTKPKIDMPSSDEENVGRVSFSNSEHIRGAFALTDADSITARYGDKVYFYAEPDEGYGVSDVYLHMVDMDKDGHYDGSTDSYEEKTSIFANKDTNGVYYFTMPEHKITYISFETVKLEDDMSGIKKKKQPSYYDYIAEHLNKDYVNPSSDVSLSGDDAVNATRIKFMMVVDDGTGDYLSMNIDDFYKRDTSYLQSRGLYENHTMLFDVDKNSKYYVMLANPMYKDSDIITTDWVLAKNNNDGEVLDGGYYDKATGLAYIPKKYVDVEVDGRKGYSMTEMQFMCVKKSDASEHKITVSVNGSGAAKSLTKTGELSFSDARPDMVIDLVTNESMTRKFTTNDIKVSINGVLIDENVYYDDDGNKSDFYTYNDMNGSLTITGTPFEVSNIDIDIDVKENALNTQSKSTLTMLADAVFPSTKVKAAALSSKWQKITVYNSVSTNSVDLQYDSISIGDNMDFVKNKKAMFDHAKDNTGTEKTYYFKGKDGTLAYVQNILKHNVSDAMKDADSYGVVGDLSAGATQFSLKLKRGAKTTARANKKPKLKINVAGDKDGWRKFQMVCGDLKHAQGTGGSSNSPYLQVKGVCVMKGTVTSGKKTIQYVYNAYTLQSAFGTQSMNGVLGFRNSDSNPPKRVGLDVLKYASTKFPNRNNVYSDDIEDFMNNIQNSDDYIEIDNPHYSYVGTTITLYGYATEADRTAGTNCVKTVLVSLNVDGEGSASDSDLRDANKKVIPYWRASETAMGTGMLSPAYWFVSNDCIYTSCGEGTPSKDFNIKEGDTDKMLEVIDKAASTQLNMQKVYDRPSFVNGNENYDLAATFNVAGPYVDENCTNPCSSYGEYQLNTDAKSGFSSALQYLELGYYKVTETLTSKGTAIKSTTQVVNRTGLSGENVACNVTHMNKVKYDLIVNLLTKQDRNHGSAVGDTKLDGIKFRISVYDSTKTSYEGVANGSNVGFLYSFEAKTKSDGNGKGTINLNRDGGCIIGNPIGKSWNDLYGDDNVMDFPISFVKIEEIDTSGTGYSAKSPSITSATGAKLVSNNCVVAQISDNGSPTVATLDCIGENQQTFGNTPLFAGIKIHKYDWDRITRENAGHESDNDLEQGDAKLSGIKFKVYNISNRKVYLEDNPSKLYDNCTENNLSEAAVVATLVTDSKGEAQTPATLPYGTYLIVESKEDGNGKDMNTDENCGYLVNSDFKFKAVLHPTEAENHKIYTTTDMIKSASGIDMSKTQTEATLNAHKEIPVDPPKRGGIILQKVMKDCENTTAKHDGYTGAKKYTNDTPIGEGDISLAGAEFTVFSISAEDVCVYNDTAGKSYKWAKSYKASDLANAKFQSDSKGNYWYYDANGNKLESCLTIKTDSKGVAKSIVNALPYGTYVIRETKAPTGAHVNDDWNVTFKIRKHNTYEDLTKSFSNTVTSSSADKFTRTKNGYAPVLEVPFRGNVMIEKDDKEYGKSEANGGKDHGNNKNGTHLEGIEFTIKNKSTYPVYVDTDDDGILEEYASGADIYKIYTKWDKVRKKYVASTAPWDEKNQTFVTNEAVTYKDKDYSIAYKLPYGIYSIRETDTTDSYILEDKTEYTFAIRSSKQLQTKYVKGSTTNFADMIYYNSVVRGDFEFEKQIERKEDELSSVFVVTNQTTGERHVIVTDRNGEYRSDKDWTRHEYQTNYNDVLLEKIDKGEVIDMDKMVTNYKHSQTGNQSMTNEQISSALKEAGDGAFLERCGLWFSLGEDGSTSKPSIIRGVDYREHGALPYGMYTIREVRTTTNTNYDMIDWNVWIYNDNSENNNRVDCGTKENSGDEKIRIASRAKDVSTEKNIGLAYDKAVIEDEVSFEQLVVGNKYTLVGRLYDKTTETYIKNEDGTDYTVERELRPGYVDSEDEVWSEKEGDFTKGSCVQTFKFDASKYEGHTIVVYEVLYDNKDKMPIVAARHCDKNDTKQTIHYPKIRTENLSDIMKDHDNPTKGEVTLTDTITYTNLLPNKRYTVTGILMDKDAGDEAMDKDKNYIQAETTFTPEEADGELKLTYKFDAEGFEGKTLVSFVTVNQGGDDVGLHANLEDESQSIHFPKIQTTALDKTTQMHESLAEDPVTIIDTVAYKNLLPGKTYTMSGTLMNKKTGEKLLDSDGNEITATAEFTPEFADGTVDIEFTFNGNTLAGTTTVAFETLTREDVELTTHTDIEDEDQTVHFPKIQTTATYGDDAVNEGKAIKNLKIVDTVYYENLTPGEEYEVTGILMDKDTKTPVVNIKDEKKSDSVSGSAVSGDKTDTTTQTAVTIKSTKKFVPEKAKGYLTVTFEFDGTDYAGHDLVVFENLYHNGFHVATHEDYEDEGQTIHLPKIGTTLTDKNTHLHESTVAKEITLVDTVAYKNLQIGKKYVVTGVLYDKATGEKLLVDGKEVTATKEFTPEKKNGAVDIEFVFNSEALRGHTVVAFEDVYHDNLNVATHADIEDEDQSVAFPNIKTVATKSGTEEKIIYVNDKASITDVITYNNVIKDHTYKVIGTLMSKSSQKEVVDKDGKPITAETGFVATDDKGSVELTFEFDATKYGNDKIVCFDNLYVVDTTNVDKDGKATDVLLLEDKDFENEDETITIPKPSLHTTAVNGESKTKQMSYGKKATIVDTVTYKNLNPGTNYKVTGTLMNKKTGEPIVNASGAAITSTAEFVPTEKDGTVDVTFIVDTKGLVGQSIVVFENVSLNDIDIAIHANIKDKEQTTYVMSVKTKAAASDKRSKVIDLSKKAVIIDTVTYKNLVAGETYIVTGKLMNKATGKALQKDGADYTVSKEFKPDKAFGDVDIKFTVDTTELKDATLVVFEDVTTTNGTLIGQHHDINDANQSVVIKTTTKVQTGVRNFAMWVAILISIASVLLIGAFAYVRRRRRLAMIRSTRK